MSEPIPAATVVTLRETDTGIEVLMLRKNSKLNYGGMWVFPGGRIDAEDYGVSKEDILFAARNAAAREAEEEASINLSPESLHFFAHWTTPNVRPKRFSTWFFMGQVEGDHDVVIDGGEIHDFVWQSPKKMLEAHTAGEVEMAGPTFITLDLLQDMSSYAAAVEVASREEPCYYEPRVVIVDDGRINLYQGDAGFETKDVDVPGKRHRLWANKTGGWRYEKNL
ncbi:MAG: NUDIX domain-containing protein [Pseudomonadales bacterium]|nr:NUDIX domain-containing protein [Pseudomonadales bacterium]